jgi:predicted nucleic acid-binding protein
VDLIADTTFLVGLWRRQKWAIDFASGHRSLVVGLPWVVLGEFRHGALRANHSQEEVDRFLELGISMLDPSPVIPAYARICTVLQENHPSVYGGIGQNDLWIAAVAVETGRPLLSRNRRHFDKIDSLELVILDAS